VKKENVSALKPEGSQKQLAETIQYVMEHFGDIMYRNCGRL
jgi:hypothetical protein